MTRAVEIEDIHEKIASELPPLSHLICPTCEEVLYLGKIMAETYLREGWPKCCKQTMTLITKAQLCIACNGARRVQAVVGGVWMECRMCEDRT